MKFVSLLGTRTFRTTVPKITTPFQTRSFQHDFVPRDPSAKPKRYKYPAFYVPYGPKPPPSEKVIQLAEKIAALAPEVRRQIGPALQHKLRHPKIEKISTEGMDFGSTQVGPGKPEEKKVEKTAFDVKLEKFDAAAKIKVIKEVRSFTSLGLKEAKELVEKVPVVIKQGITKEEANDIIEKIKAIGGVAVMEFVGDLLYSARRGRMKKRQNVRIVYLHELFKILCALWISRGRKFEEFVRANSMPDMMNFNELSSETWPNLYRRVNHHPPQSGLG